MNTISLVIGEGEEAMLLRNKIQQLTSCHDVQICKQKESFELCNSKGFVLIWLIMTTPVGPDTLSLTTSIRYVHIHRLLAKFSFDLTYWYYIHVRFRSTSSLYLTSNGQGKSTYRSSL